MGETYFDSGIIDNALVEYRALLTDLALQSPTLTPSRRKEIEFDRNRRYRREFQYPDNFSQNLEIATRLCESIVWGLENIQNNLGEFNSFCVWGIKTQGSFVNSLQLPNVIECSQLAQLLLKIYVFHYEIYATNDFSVHFDFSEMLFILEDYAKNVNDDFRYQLHFVKVILPSRIFKQQFSGVNFAKLKNIDFEVVEGIDFNKLSGFDVDRLNDHMDKGDLLFGSRQAAEDAVTARLNQLDAHRDIIERYSTDYGFLELSLAFSSMKKDKDEELRAASKLMNWFSLCLLAIPFCLVVVVLHSFGVFGDAVMSPQGLHQVFAGGVLDVSSLKLILPVVSIEFLLLYFYRVKLHETKALSAQILQIKHRLSLCQFIKDYANFSKTLHVDSPNLLEKFETLIFSPIVVNEGDIPGSLDGFTQVIDLIKSKS